MFFTRYNQLKRYVISLDEWCTRRISQLEVQIMANKDATARLEASTTAALATVATVLDAANTEIAQLADAVANGGATDDVSDRLNAVSDKLDAANTQLGTLVSALQADDPAVVPAPVDPTNPAKQ